MSKTGSGKKEPTHWASFEERGVYLGLRTMLGVYRVLGRTVFSIILLPVVFYFFLFSSQTRDASRGFLERVYAFPTDTPMLKARPGWSTAFHHFYAFGQSILDKIAAWSGEVQIEDITFENSDVFDRFAEEGRGAVMIGSHLGNMEVCRALSQKHRNIKLNVLVHTKHSENFNRLVQSVNPDSGVSLIQTTEVGPGTAMQLQAAVDRGEIIVIVGDRTPQSRSGRHGWAPFLGAPAPFPQGPYILASLFKCPVLLIFCVKQKDGYHITLERFADQIVLPRKSRDEALQTYIQKFAARLEFHALRSPYQWFNFFDFWKQAGDAPAQKTRKEEGV